jgi:hypothetical protein
MNHSPDRPEPDRPRRSLVRKSALLGALLVGLAVTLAACSSGSSGSGSTTTTTTAASAGSSSSGASNTVTQQSLKYAQCMRAHGVTGYADPAPGKAQSIGGSGLDTSSPTYQAAASACKKDQPTAGNGTDQGPTPAAQTAQLKFAECMRSHGVTKFPEGTGNGGGQQSLSQYGIDTNSPTFLKANQACSSLLGP